MPLTYLPTYVHLKYGTTAEEQPCLEMRFDYPNKIDEVLLDLEYVQHSDRDAAIGIRRGASTRRINEVYLVGIDVKGGSNESMDFLLGFGKLGYDSIRDPYDLEVFRTILGLLEWLIPEAMRDVAEHQES